jgi:uncharacterized protein (TIGR03435 family)
MRRFLLTCATLLALGSAAAVRGQAPATPPSFQTVSIEPSIGGLIKVAYAPRSFTAHAISLVELIDEAYGVKAWEVFGGPDWARVDRFTVKATTATEVPRERMKLMLQALLTERFQLQLAPETQSVSLYRLSASDVRKLTPVAKPSGRPVINVKEIRDAAYRWEGRNATMSSLTVALSQHLRAPVVDDTTLTGAFDFRFEFVDVSAFGRDDGDQLEGRSIVNALEKQAGLTLLAGTGPVPGHAIRRASRP